MLSQGDMIDFNELTCARVATTKPKQSAICGTDGLSSPKPVVEAIPTETKSKVPINSATSMRHMFLLSVISWTPIISLTPARRKKKKKFC